MIEKAEIILKKTFGYSEFRPLQRDIINSILKKRDALVIMPTGGGKSLCYQIPALIFDGLTVVVSPLISLMKDQVEQLRESGVEAVLLNSMISSGEYRYNIMRIREGAAKILYIAPESLLKHGIMEMLSSVKVDCLAIDEAHCISEWGHDFRPDYRQLVHVRDRFPDAVCAAFTATATPRVQEDIRKSLNFTECGEFIGSFNRENLFIQVVPKDNPAAQTLEFLERYRDQSGIIYCFSRQQVDDLAMFLNERGFSVKPYHAGLPESERNMNQELFIRDDVQIIVATIAFGMGINKPNVRFVVHYDLPKNIESYYQEIGRAGRDGLRAECLLLFSYSDIHKIKYFFKEKNEKERRVASAHLDALVKYAESDSCRREGLLRYFGENYSSDNCGTCDNCLSTDREESDLTVAAQKFLSCVKRTNEMFGAGHIIDVLRGSKNRKILKFGHQELSTYGIGKEYSKKEWLNISRQFVLKELLVQDMEFGSLKVTEKGYDVLKGLKAVTGYLVADRSGINKGEAERISDAERELDYELFTILRRERKSVADKLNVPPYVVFPDKTLVEMAVYFPQSLESLIHIHGVGESKLARFGPQFLRVICDYCRDKNIEEKIKAADIKTKSKPSGVSKKRFQVIGELYNSGRSVQDIMDDFGIQKSTVLDNLYRFARDGFSIDSGRIIEFSASSEDERAKVIEAFERKGTDFLRPVHEYLGGSIDYEELKVIRLYYLYRYSGKAAASA